MGSCFEALSKTVLVIFNLLLFLAGLVPFIVGIIAVANEELLTKMIGYIPGSSNMTALIKSGAIYFIVIGIIVTVIGFLGLFGACCKSKCLLGLYLTLLILIVLAEIAVIIVAVAFPDTFNKTGQNIMKESLKEYKIDCHVNKSLSIVQCSEDALTLAWDAMQFELQCCGAVNYTDYSQWAPNFVKRNPNASAPLTCCNSQNTGKFVPIFEYTGYNECYETGLVGSNYFVTGCFGALLHWIATTPAVIGVMDGIGGLEIILIILSIVQLCVGDRKD
jgi:hypothetical protein